MARPATGSTSPDALDLAHGIPAWEHQPGETAEAYERFQQFLEVDPLVRTKNRMAVVHDLLRNRDPHMCSVAALQNMASLHHWHTRAAAYDKDKRDRLEQATAAAEEKWAETLASRRAETRLKHLDIADEVIKTGLRALAVKDLDDSTLSELRGLIDLGVKIERETLGLTAPRAQNTPDTGHINDLDDDQAAARLRQLADEVARRVNNNTTAAAAPDVLDAEVVPPGSSDDDHQPTRLAIDAPRPERTEY